MNVNIVYISTFLKGITSGSAGSAPLFIRPADTPQELDFRDNNFSFDDDSKFMMGDDVAKDPTGGYGYQAGLLRIILRN